MSLKILVADDSAFMRNIIKNILTQNGVTDITEAQDGQEAINKFKEINPNLIFMDIMMPNKTGLEALKEIRATNPEAKIIMCTSVGQEKIVQEAVESGAEDFIIKPFKQEDIQEVLKNYQ